MTKITKQSIHEEFDKEFGTSSSRNIFMRHWDKYNEILYFQDTQILKLVDQVVPEEKVNDKECTCEGECYANHSSFNQAIAEIKQNLKDTGYEI